MDEYIQEFNLWIAKNDLTESEEPMVARYLDKLRQHIQDAMKLHSLWTVKETYHHTVVAKEQ